VNLLLDTHIALWAIADDSRMPEKARSFILDPQNTIWVSAVNVWEIAIKHRLGREVMPISGHEALTLFRRSGFKFLSVEPEHAAAVDELPMHHQDPFDRLLVAQALITPMRLMTHDRSVARYSDSVMLV
jgi:PIN domain nuclease of toxin-antitoxin system